MKMDMDSCEKCGVVVDLEKLRGIEDKKTVEQQASEDYGQTYQFRDFGKFKHFRCPVCKAINQRD